MSDPQLVKIVSRDREEFEVERGVATMSTLIAGVCKDVAEKDIVVPLPNVDAKILAKVIEYCRYHYESRNTDQSKDDIDKWDKEFIKVDNPTLFNIIIAANFMDIQSLLDLCCQTVANMIQNKDADTVRDMFCIENDFTPEEEEWIKRENSWWIPSIP